MEWANLSAEDVMKLEESGIVKIIYPEETITNAGNNTQAEATSNDSDTLSTNETKEDGAKE